MSRSWLPTAGRCESAALGICYNTGQSCGALSRLFVPRELYDTVVEKVRATMATIRVGYGPEDADMGPLVSEEQLERVLGYVGEGCREGAKLVFGGRRPDSDPLSRGYYIEPTLFGEAQPGMRIVEEEIFGPVLSILTFDSEEHAVELAHASSPSGGPPRLPQAVPRIRHASRPRLRFRLLRARGQDARPAREEMTP